MNLTALPNEVLGKVMGFLSFDDLFVLERVNKQLRKVVLNVAWPKIDTIDHETIIKFTNYPLFHRHDIHKNRRHKLTNESIELIISRAKNLRLLDLSIYYDTLITAEICFHLHLAPQLLSINLAEVRLTNDSLKIIAGHCPKLANINLEYCFFNYKEKIEISLKFLFQRCKNIRNLNIGYSSSLIGESFEYIPLQLKYLNLNDCDKLTSAAMNFLVDRAPNLETLILTMFFPNEDVNIWLRKLVKLRFLELECSEEAYPPLNFSHMIELEMLRLAASRLVTPETLESLKHCPKLKGLDLSFYDEGFDGSLLEILMEYKALKYCQICGWENLNNYIVDFVQTRQIEYFAINDCPNLSKDVLKTLIYECNSLSLLEVEGEFYNEKFFHSIFTEKNSNRFNILKLVTRHKVKGLSSLKWCEITTHSSLWISNAIEQNLSSL